MARLPHIVRKRKKSKIMGNPDTVSHQDIAGLAGVRHSRKAGRDVPRRHGTNPGSVKLAGPTIPIRVPRLRDPE